MAKLVGPFTVTVIKNVSIRINRRSSSDPNNPFYGKIVGGSLHKLGDVITLQGTEIDRNVAVLAQLGFITITPPLPADAFSQAEVDSEFDRDPLYPFIFGYIEDTDSLLRSIHVPVQNLTAARAIPPNERFDKMILLVEDEASGYRYDAQSLNTDDNNLFIKPADLLPTQPGRWIRYTALTGTSATAYAKQSFTPANGQTLFTLGSVVAPLGMITVSVNGVTYREGDSYIISGNQLQWQDDPFTLDTMDELEVQYQLP